MASLTPKSRSSEVTADAMSEGLANGAMVLVPCLGGLYAAMQNANFRKITNWQSRTAMVVMPVLFTFAITSEKKIEHRMKEIAEETEHAMKTVQWAEREQLRNGSTDKDDEKLRELYRRSIMTSGVRLVPGTELSTFQKSANYIQSNPFKVIAGIGVPAVAVIFYGRGQAHLSTQMQILHTRVIGQFTVICTLLSIMGLKEMMDRSGRYITEADLENRVLEMEKTRHEMNDRLEHHVFQGSRVVKN